MGSYAELHQQQGGLLATDSRNHGYADLYLQQQSEATARRSYSSFHPRQTAEAASRRSYPSEKYRVVVSALDDGCERRSSSMMSPGQQDSGGYAVIAAATVAAVTETVGHESSPTQWAKGVGNGGSPSPSPRQRLDPSVSRPATTILAQATAMRSAKLKQLAQRQQQQQLVQSSQPGSTPAAGGKTGKQQVRLSAVLQLAPHLYDRHRLSAVEKFIDKVDILPARYAEAQVVFLSKNSLTTVAGLEQFKQLRVLGLADNLLTDPEQLDALAAACPGLEALSLEGNPIAYVPHYRARIALMLPNLKSLDGRPITDEERAAAPAAVAAEEATMAVLMRNACEVHKMASVVQRAQLHMELLHVMHSRGAVLRRVEALGDAATAVGGRSLARLVDMWDYESFLTVEERRKIRGALLREVGRMFRQIKVQQPASSRALPSWEEAFAQVMTAQQQTTAMLLDLLTQCQLAIDELLRSMAGPLGRGSNDAFTGLDGGPGTAGGSGGVEVRALLLREAEADMERHRAMRREREEVLAEFRDTAIKQLRSSPSRSAQRPALKSSLKRTSKPLSRPGGGDGDGDGGSDGAEDRQSPHSAPPRWQSARSSPLAQDAVKRIMRARQGVAPTRACSSSSTSGASARHKEEGFSHAVKATSALPTKSQHFLARTPGEDASSETGSANARLLGRPMSVDRISVRYEDQQEAMTTVNANGPGATSRSAAGALGHAGHRRCKSVDAGTLHQRGGTSSNSGRTVPTSAGRTQAQQRRRNSVVSSPEKSPMSPASPPQRRAWRPGGGTQGCGRSPPSPVNYKDAAHAVERAMRKLRMQNQETAGTSPERVRALAASAAAVVAVAAGAVADGSTLRPPKRQVGLPDRGITTSPTILGRRHQASTGALTEVPPHLAAAGSLQKKGPSQNAPQARRSLQDELMGVPAASNQGLMQQASGKGTHRTDVTSSPGSRLRASSPAAPGSQAGVSGSSSHAAVASARIDDLRRELEESARETARLRQIAETAAMPLPSRLPQAADAPVAASGWLPQPPPWSVVTTVNVNTGGTDRGPSPPHWSQNQRISSGPQYSWQVQSGPQPVAPPPWYSQGATWDSQVDERMVQSPQVDVSLRPKEWRTATQDDGPGTSPLPQPQMPPPALQPHRAAWPGPSPAGSTSTVYGVNRTVGAEGSGAGFVDLYPAAQRADNPSGDAAVTPPPPPRQQQQNELQQQQQVLHLNWHGERSGGAGPARRTAAPLHNYTHARDPTGGVAVSYDTSFSASGLPYQHQHPTSHLQRREEGRWGSEGSAPTGGAFVGPSASAWTSAGTDARMMPPPPPPPPLLQPPLTQDAGSGFPARQPLGAQDGTSGHLQQPYASQLLATEHPPASLHLRLHPPPFPGGPSTAPLAHGSALQEYPAPQLLAAPFQAQLQHPQHAFPSSSWQPQDAVSPQQSHATWTPANVNTGAEQHFHPSGLGTLPQLSEAFPAPSAPEMPTPGHSEQVTLGDFSLMRASMDVAAPGSMQPSVTGTPRYSQQADGTNPGFPFHSLGPTADGVHPEQPMGVVDTPWQQSLPPLHLHEGLGQAELLRPHTLDSVATPAITLRGPPGSATAAAAATQAITTVVSVVDEGGGGGGGAGATRVNVSEVLHEDSTVSNDQHIHLHIHPPPVQVPGTAGTDASTPQLFLQPAPEAHRGSAAAASPADAVAPSTSFGLLVQPGSPLHEALSVGNLVYERIERIKPAGLTSSPDTMTVTRSAATGTVGIAVGSFDNGDGRPSRRASRRRSTKTDTETPRQGGAGSTSTDGGGGGGRCRDEHQSFGYRRQDEDDDSSNGRGGGGSHGSGGDSYDLRRGSRPGGAGKAGSGEGSRSGTGAGGHADHGKRTRGAMQAQSRTSESSDLDDGIDDTDLSRDGGGDGDRRDDSYDDSVSDDLPGAGGGHRLKASDRSHRLLGHEGAGDGKRRVQQKCNSPDVISKNRNLSEQVLELPPALQQQYVSMQRQLAEQAAMNATLSDQLQRLQGQVSQAPQEETPGPNQHAMLEHEDDGYGLQTESWASSIQHVAGAGPTGRSSDTDGSGMGTGSGAAASSPVPLRHSGGSASVTPCEARRPGPNSPAHSSRTSLRLPMCISPVATTSQRASPREADSTHSTLSLMPGGLSPQSAAVEPVRVPPPEPSSQSSPRAPGGSKLIQDQLLRNQALQEQISRLGEQLADPAALTAGVELPPELAAALASLAASSAPLPPGSLRALEQQLVAMTLEKEAVERVLLQEQAEVRMLQQELGVMSQVATALEETQAQLQEARLAVAHQQEELQERDQQLVACREREAQLETELAAERERARSQVTAIASYFEQQFEDARAAIVAELRSQIAAMRAGRSDSYAHDSRPDSFRMELDSQLSGLRNSEVQSQLSQRDAPRANLGAQLLHEQLSSRSTAGDLTSQIAASLSAALESTRSSTHRGDSAATAASLEHDIHPSLDAVFATLPDALRVELEAQFAIGRATLAAQVAEVLRDDTIRQLESRYSAPVGNSLGRSRLQEAFEAEHAAQLAVMRAEHTMQMEIMRARHAAQVEELLAEKVMQPEAIREEYAAQLARVRADHAKQLEELRTRHAVQVEELLADRAREPEALRTEHAAKVAALYANHARQMEALRTEHAEQLEELLSERSRQPEALRTEHATRLAALREEHLGQMEALRSGHAAQMEVLLAERSAQPEALRSEHASQMAVLRAEHAKQMEILRAEHAKEMGVLLAERAALPETLRVEHAAQLEAMRSEHASRLGALRAEHTTQMEAMRSSHAAQLEALLAERDTQPDVLKAEHAAQLAALRADHVKQMEAIRAEHKKQMEDLPAARAAEQRDMLRAEHAAQLASLRTDHTKHMEVMRAELTSRIEALLVERTAVTQALRDEHATQLETIRANHASQLAAQSAEHAKQMEVVRAEHAKQMEQLVLEQAAQPEMIRAGYSTQVAALRAEHAMQMEALRADHAAALAEKERQRAISVATHEQQLQELHAEHQRRMEELAVQARQRFQRQEAEHHSGMTALTEEYQTQISRHTRRLDELLARHKQQLDELAESNRRQLDDVRLHGEKLLAEAREAAERGASEAAAAHEKALAELAGRLRAAEVAEAAAAAVRREGEAARKALQTQLDEVLAHLSKERATVSELRARNQALEVAEMEVRRRWEKLMAPRDLGVCREVKADKLGGRLLLRRVLGRWAANARLSRRHKHQIAVIVELRRRRVCRQAMHHWRTTVLRTRVLRALLHGSEISLMRRALVSLRAQALQRRRKVRAISIAFAHWSVRQLSRCFEAWRQLHRMHARAAAYSDPAALRSAVAHRSSLVLRAALTVWHQHVYQTQLPKTQRRRRAARVYRRRLLWKAMAGFAQQAERRILKRSQLGRSIRRHRFSELNRAIACWLRYLEGARRKRSLLAVADLQYGHSVVQRWRRAACRSQALRVGMAALQASAGTRRLRTCWTRWRTFLLRGRQSALALRLASEHHRGALLWRCMSVWLHLAQQSAARQLHIKGMREYQRMMQAALRWQRLVELSRRQQAVVDRAVRLYRHRVLASTQRAVLRHWRALVEGRRGLLRSAAVSFVQAYLSVWRRRVFAAWHGVARRASGDRGIEAALELQGALARNEAAMRQVSARLEAVGAENSELMDQLKEAQSEVMILRKQLEDSEKRLAETVDALATADRELEAQGADLGARAEKVAALEEARDVLLERVNELRQQVSAGEVSCASLQEQASSLQRSLVAAQSTVKELGLKMQQQAAHYEEQLLAARDEASLARRDAGSLAATASRLEQQAADSEAQLRSMRTGHEALVASLRQELRARDAHIMALNHQQQQQRDSASLSRPVSATTRFPSPAFSSRPMSGDPRPRSGSTDHATMRGGPRHHPLSHSSDGGQEAMVPDQRGLGVNADLATVQGETSDAWELPRDSNVGPQPLFEPSTLGPTAAAAAARPDKRPWSSAGARTGRVAPASGALLRTSLLTQPLLQTRAPSAVTAPQAPPAQTQRMGGATATPRVAEDLWSEGSCTTSTSEGVSGIAVEGATVAGGAAAVMTAASVLPSEAVLVSQPSGQRLVNVSMSDWPQPQDSDRLVSAQAEDRRDGSGRGDGDEDDLPPPAHHYGASGAFRRLQAAEAALLVTEEEFQRRRSRILGLGTVASVGNTSTAGGDAGALQPHRSLSPRRPHRATSTGGIGDAGIAHRPQNTSMSGAGKAPLRRSTSALPDRISLQSSGDAAAWDSDPQAQPHASQLEQPVLLGRNPSTDPGNGNVGSCGAGTAADGSDGGALQAQAPPQPELRDLTAGIVGTLTNLREALRSQSRPPPQPPTQRLGFQQPLHASATTAHATFVGGGAHAATGPGPAGGAAPVATSPRTGAMHRTVTFWPSPYSSAPSSAATSESGVQICSATTSGGGGGSASDAIELTLRSLLNATAPPPLPGTSSQQLQADAGPQQILQPARHSGETATSDTTRLLEARLPEYRRRLWTSTAPDHPVSWPGYELQPRR
ncbi:hypothetical protein Vafri_10769 [Volvox africanus]|uniref:Uncharacterized protein n=1 Tax=Volvox africanus TaxID=51714 RepID=A0A8J4BB84_9CHLO|nr:hypothetical protein Vafri_10769 [Volvox africanus]